MKPVKLSSKTNAEKKLKKSGVAASTRKQAHEKIRKPLKTRIDPIVEHTLDQLKKSP